RPVPGGARVALPADRPARVSGSWRRGRPACPGIHPRRPAPQGRKTVRAWRLAFKMQRLELLLFAVAAVVLLAASLLIARGASEARTSFDACFRAAGSDPGCATSPSLNDFSMW